MKNKEKPIYLLLFALAFAVNIAGINVKFFTDDPGLYAAIAKNMVNRHDFLRLFSYNQDWLDKPHFPFWMAAISFKIFGISVWAYRLPALLFFLMAARYTYLFARKYYDWEAAAVAVLILMTSQYAIMSNTDIRAEPYLMGLLIGSIYHIANLEDKFSVKDLLLAALLTACAIMTKGLFVIVPIYGALLGELIFKKKLGALFSSKFIGLYALTLLFTLPEFYALYVQFDQHPEKLVFDRHNVSGIKWFLWDSQFGRFANSGPISRNKGNDIFFYLHTLLWAFAPWCLMFYYAVYKSIRKIWYKTALVEYYTLSGGLLLLILFSLSKFQLPFYTNIIFPLFAIVTAPYCYKQLSVWGNRFRLYNQWVYIVLFTLLVFVINFFLKPASSTFFVMACGLFLVLISLINRQIKDLHRKAFFVTCSAALFANFYLATVLYPTITTAGGGQVAAAKYINQPQFSNYHVYAARMESNVFQFECDKPIDFVPIEAFAKFNAPQDNAFFVTQYSLNYLNNNHIPYRVIQSFQNYSQERILPAFVNSDTRDKTLDKIYLISK